MLQEASGNPAGAAQSFGQAASDAASTIDQVGQQTGASPSDIGQAQSDLQDIQDQQVMSMVKQAAGSDEDGNAKGVGMGAAGGGKGSWLMMLAKALGKQLDAAQNDLEKTMNGTDWKKSDQVATFHAKSQEFSLCMNTATNVLKTVGSSEHDVS